MPQGRPSFRSGGTTFRVYYCSVVAFSLAYLGWGLLSPHFEAAPRVSIPLTALWTAFYILSLALRIPTDQGAYFMVSAALDYAGIILLGPVPTACINFVTTVGYETLVRRPALQALFNGSVYALMCLTAGDIYLALSRWNVATYLLHSGVLRNTFAMAVAAVVYILVNKLAVSAVISLYSRVPLRQAWYQNYRKGMMFPVVSLSTGLLIAEVCRTSGVFGALLGVLPLILFWYYFQLYGEIRHDLRDFVRALTSIIEEVDPYTRNHSLRVSNYAVQIARGMGLPEREVEVIEFGGLLHDLGKVRGDLRGLLQKTGRLTPEERRRMDAHPGTGADIVASVRTLSKAAEVVRSHHERLDGKGYPQGLKGDEVPLGARIVLVADTFDAMTSDRPYRAALTAEKALQELDKYSGTQFDPRVVEALRGLIAAGTFQVLYTPVAPEQIEQPVAEIAAS